MPEEDWERIKRYQKQGVSMEFCADEIGWSKKCVRRAYASNTYEEYRKSGSYASKQLANNLPTNDTTQDLLSRIYIVLTAIAKELGCLPTNV